MLQFLANSLCVLRIKLGPELSLVTSLRRQGSPAGLGVQSPILWCLSVINLGIRLRIDGFVLSKYQIFLYD